MKGRITSNPSSEQRIGNLLRLLRERAWTITDTSETTTLRAREFPQPDADQAYATAMATCVFHVGFVSIAETDEHIKRLRNEPVACDYSPARSRFIRHVGSHFVSPINMTAAKVSGGDDGR